MSKCLRCFVCVLLLLVSACFSQQQGQVLVITNGTILDGTGAELMPEGLVAVQEGRIIYVGPATGFDIPNGAEVVDANGGTIMPGIIDAHTHKISLLGLEVQERFLRAGVTTIRDLGSMRRKDGLKDLVERLQGQDGIPTFIMSGPIITAVGGYPTNIDRNIAWQVSDINEAINAVNSLASSGAGVIKIGLQEWSGPLLTVEQIQAIVKTAHGHGLRVSAHVWGRKEVELAIAGGVDELAHLPVEKLTDCTISLLIDQGISIIPTIYIWTEMYQATDEETYQWAINNMRSNLTRFVAAGGNVAFGTDYPASPNMPEGMPIYEMEKLLEFGMSPMEVIMAATSNAAHVCGLGDSIGTLEVGKMADIIVVNGNPLEDITVMSEVLVVVKNGKLVIETK